VREHRTRSAVRPPQPRRACGGAMPDPRFSQSGQRDTAGPGVPQSSAGRACRGSASVVPTPASRRRQFVRRIASRSGTSGAGPEKNRTACSRRSGGAIPTGRSSRRGPRHHTLTRVHASRRTSGPRAVGARPAQLAWLTVEGRLIDSKSGKTEKIREVLRFSRFRSAHFVSGFANVRRSARMTGPMDDQSSPQPNSLAADPLQVEPSRGVGRIVVRPGDARQGRSTPMSRTLAAGWIPHATPHRKGAGRCGMRLASRSPRLADQSVEPVYEEVVE